MLAFVYMHLGLSPLTTTENPPDPSTVTPPPSERPTVGAIVGGLIGAALIAVLVAVVILIWLRHEGTYVAIIFMRTYAAGVM